ncbi:MAG: hypothetical protein U0Y68_11680 [Blastocatellia bacterium]
MAILNDTSPKTGRLTRVKADPANPDIALAGSETVLLGSLAQRHAAIIPIASVTILTRTRAARFALAPMASCI